MRAALERHLGAPDSEEPETEAHAPALDGLCDAFALTAFERGVLLLCAGVELDAELAALCAEARHDPRAGRPTFSLALAALPGGHWSALAPAAPLRRWRLLEPVGGGALTTAPLRIDERVLHHLVGVEYLDERLDGIVGPALEPAPLPRSHARTAAELAERWIRRATAPLVELLGGDVAAKRPVAAAACRALGMKLHPLAADDIPAAPAEQETLRRLWTREAHLAGAALLVELEALEDAEDARLLPVTRFVDRLEVPVLVTARESLRDLRRASLRIDVERPPADEQDALWRAALGGDDPAVDALVGQFDLSAAAIEAAAAEAGGEDPAAALWDACRAQARPRLDDLAERVVPAAAWDDLILPQEQKAILRDIVAQVRHRRVVHGTWGFAERGERGLGIAVLFAGGSGTGKTMAAEVLARDLRLDLYRIDLSSVVSKYIGETEKNLRRVFDAADAGGAILLFDEADALFGKRSEVKDSHDRYANIEVGYLLQRMEAYRGLAILTTNLRSALDQAFLRRLRFVVDFPFPDAAQRREIWRGIYPAATPLGEIDWSRLAQLSVAGGNIRNIALNAAFQAAATGESVAMAHILRAARSEYAKLERPLTGAETDGWR